ncbi:uncharacterized protein E0L32_007470 [Thyridium curvatum]|uniref:Xylanolytic transcriptional activator regulatory domain-containing protein n=1 Tax=Thyridium curvatum TaxID=1093900 RepID=A0A507AVJ4_9PEZI|nr:uncharacterized protein E0L32_007470 [Thyridium curvatum]TPX11733.1 hypothetical protein E0L32_007470 [Thyridium curvatum]
MMIRPLSGKQAPRPGFPSEIREIINRLLDIEDFLRTHLPNIAAVTSDIHASVARVAASNGGAVDTTSPLSHNSLPASSLQASRILAGDISTALGIPSWGPEASLYAQLGGLDGGAPVENLPPLTIPVGHKTSSNYLLCLPAMKQLIGEYPSDLFFILESRNPLPAELASQSTPVPLSREQLDKDLLDYLVAAFFADAYRCHPILDAEEFRAIYMRFLEDHRRSVVGIEAALCYVIFALGAAGVAPPGSQDFHISPPGMEYMQQALPTLISMSSWSFSYSNLLPQALVLASVYFAYITRPLQSWRLIYSASTLLQFKLSRLSTHDSEPSSRESILRIFWSCFIVECDRLAELELPQSGLQQLIDQTSLPSFADIDAMQSTSYLAEMSIRRLLNRVHNSLYPRQQSVLALSSTTLTAVDEFSAKEIASVTTICDELHRQLDSWYESIPEPHRPSLGTEPTGNDRLTVLRIRYFAARHIIFRPFVLYVTMHNLQQVSDDILEKARLCLDSCRAYLQNTSEILRKQSQYTWTFSLSQVTHVATMLTYVPLTFSIYRSLGALVVLTLASRNLALTRLVSDIDELQSLAINNVTPWAYPGSSLDTVLSIMQEMQRKQRILGCL